MRQANIPGISPQLIFIFLLAFFVRILFMAWSFQYRENTDVLRYRDWARVAYLWGFGHTYKTDHLMFGTLPNNQPPGTLYLLSGMYQAGIQVSKIILRFTQEAPGANAFINGPLLNGLLRLPSIIADLLIGYLVYHLIRINKNKRMALLSASLFLFNPVAIYNSSFWGQMDAIPALLFLAGLYFWVRRQQLLSLLFVFLSFFIKLSLLYTLPIFLLFNWFYFRNILKTALYFLLSIIIILALTLPVSSDPISWWYQFMRDNAGGEITSVTAFAFNFWWMIFHPHIAIGDPKTLFSFSEIRLVGVPDSAESFGGLPLTIWGYSLFFISLIPLIRTYARFPELNLPKFRESALAKLKCVSPALIMVLAGVRQLPSRQHLEKVFLIMALAVGLGFLFLPRMHERYLYALFPLLAVVVGLQLKFIFEYLVLAVLHTLNLYIVWHPMEIFFLPYWFINNRDIQWILSLLTVGTIAWLFMPLRLNTPPLAVGMKGGGTPTVAPKERRGVCFGGMKPLERRIPRLKR